VTDQPEIVGHYQRIDEDSRIRRGFGRLELIRTQEILRRYLSAPPLEILDVGGGTGVHAEWLAADGHAVHVVDLVDRHVASVRRHAPDVPRVGRVSAEVGDARALPVEDASFDAALVFGPLYHLTERDDRLRALREARRAVRPGGSIFVAAISRFASLFDGLARGFLFEPSFEEIVRRDLEEGQHRNSSGRPEWFTTAYFHHPDELTTEAEAAGLDVVEVVGVEGLAGWLPHLAERWADERERDTILFSARAVESEPTLRALSAHLIMVTRRA
jgi:ubiquinone/menaquinone biosynthesis C-methylase UbiE